MRTSVFCCHGRAVVCMLGLIGSYPRGLPLSFDSLCDWCMAMIVRREHRATAGVVCEFDDEQCSDAGQGNGPYGIIFVKTKLVLRKTNNRYN